MNDTLPPNLERIGRDLETAWTTYRRHRRVSLVWLAAITLTATVGLALTINIGFGSDGKPRSPLSALDEARAALAGPGDGVFHVRIEFVEGDHTLVNEIWQSPASYRSTNTGQPERGGRSDGTQELYDPRTNTIYAYREPDAVPPSSLVESYTQDMRRLLAGPGAHVVGKETVDGVECIRIDSHAVAGTTTTFYADAENYRPVLERATSAGETSEFHFRTWESLPNDDRWRRLSDLRLLHPDAPVLHVGLVKWEALVGTPGAVSPSPSTG